jgi:hypothetical protein
MQRDAADALGWSAVHGVGSACPCWQAGGGPGCGRSAPMSIWRLREMRNQAVAPIMAPTQMEPMLSHMTRPVKCTSPVHAPGTAWRSELGQQL